MLNSFKIIFEEPGLLYFLTGIWESLNQWDCFKFRMYNDLLFQIYDPNDPYACQVW